MRALYNKDYPYDLECNSKIKSLKDVDYEVVSDNFYGVKFTKYDRKYIIDLCTSNNISIKKLLIDILNRLKFLNKEVFTRHYSKIGSNYYKCKNINSQLCYINYTDYDIVLSILPISGSKKIKYSNNQSSEIFNLRDSRVYMFYSKATHTLMIKYKEDINRDLFMLYIISNCRFDYILITKQTK